MSGNASVIEPVALHGPLELRRYVQIHRRPELRVVLLYLSLAGLLYVHDVVQLRDLQHAALNEFRDGSKAGLAIGGAEGLVVAADDGDNSVDAL